MTQERFEEIQKQFNTFGTEIYQACGSVIAGITVPSLELNSYVATELWAGGDHRDMAYMSSAIDGRIKEVISKALAKE